MGVPCTWRAPSRVVWALGQEEGAGPNRPEKYDENSFVTQTNCICSSLPSLVTVSQLPLNSLPSWKKERLNTQFCAFQDSNFHTHKNACSSHCFVWECVFSSFRLGETPLIPGPDGRSIRVPEGSRDLLEGLNLSLGLPLNSCDPRATFWHVNFLISQGYNRITGNNGNEPALQTAKYYLQMWDG